MEVIEITNDKDDLDLFKNLYVKALDQIIESTSSGEGRSRRAAEIKNAIDQAIKHSYFLKILDHNSRFNKRAGSPLTPSTSISTNIEKKKIKRRMLLTTEK